MKIYNDVEQIPQIKNLVLTVGSFDGVHTGHQELLSTIIEKAKQIKGSSGLMSFHPHPRMVLQPSKKDGIQLLTTIEERINLLEKAGLDYLFIVPFSVDFANMPAEKYVSDFLVKRFNPKSIVIGYDHRFGRNREGNVDLLEQLKDKFDYSIEQINQQKIENITFSSTNVRNLLLKGDIELANQLLGYKYQLSGIVAHGEKNGRELGFPTANIELIDQGKLVPAIGVYAVLTYLNNKVYKGMLNIGHRPTFDGKEKTIENHLFNFAENIYGEKLRIEFVSRIRDEKKFNSLAALKDQLKIDEKEAKERLKDIII